MNVYIVVWNFELGGVQKYSILLGNALEENGFEVVFLAARPLGEMLDLLSPTIKVEQLKVSKTNSFIGLNNLNQKLKQRIEKGAVIIANGPNNFRQIARVNYLTRRWKLIYILHNDLHIKESTFSFLKNLEMRTLLNQRCARIVGLSQKQLEKHRSLFKLKQISLIPNFIVEPHIQVLKTKRTQGLKGLCLGRLSIEKGYHILVDAVGYLKNHVDVDIYGEGKLEKEILSKIKASGLSNVKIKKPVLDIGALFPHYDFLILPSIRETFGMVIIEAFSYGLPVVCTNCDGPISLVKDRGNGLIAIKNDVKSLASKIDEMVKLIEEGFFDSGDLKNSVSQYKIENVILKYIDLIKS